MKQKNLTIDYSNYVRYENGLVLREIPLIEVELHGKIHKVCVLPELEAKARISREYGFEFNSIKIEATCWYEATDMNYFRFSVCGEHYEVKDYGVLKWLEV